MLSGLTLRIAQVDVPYNPVKHHQGQTVQSRVGEMTSNN